MNTENREYEIVWLCPNCGTKNYDTTSDHPFDSTPEPVCSNCGKQFLPDEVDVISRN